MRVPPTEPSLTGGATAAGTCTLISDTPTSAQLGQTMLLTSNTQLDECILPPAMESSMGDDSDGEVFGEAGTRPASVSTDMSSPNSHSTTPPPEHPSTPEPVSTPALEPVATHLTTGARKCPRTRSRESADGLVSALETVHRRKQGSSVSSR
eukprot:scpid85684/ scgid1817/ 